MPLTASIRPKKPAKIRESYESLQSGFSQIPKSAISNGSDSNRVFRLANLSQEEFHRKYGPLALSMSESHWLTGRRNGNRAFHNKIFQRRSYIYHLRGFLHNSENPLNCSAALLALS